MFGGENKKNGEEHTADSGTFCHSFWVSNKLNSDTWKICLLKMDFTDGLQKLALIPRSHFQPCNSRGAPQRSLTKEGLQSPGSTHVKYCAQHQRQEGHVYRDRTGSYKAGAVERQRPTSHTSPHGRNNVQLALQNHTMGFGTQQHFCSERGYRERRGRPPTLLLQHREIETQELATLIQRATTALQLH